MRKSRLLGAVCAVSLVFSVPSQAATAVWDDFDANNGSWIPNTTETTNSHQAAGGNPNGYLETTNAGSNMSFGAAGAANITSDYSGVFADGLWWVSVDLNFIRGSFSDAWLRFRFQDSTFNGWYISLEDTIFNNEWQNYSVSFNTTWDDATAQANGWVKEDAAVPSFSALWDDVYTTEVRVLGTDTLLAGIDNYHAHIVPIPAAVWLFGSGLIGLIGVARRKKAA